MPLACVFRPVALRECASPAHSRTLYAHHASCRFPKKPSLSLSLSRPVRVRADGEASPSTGDAPAWVEPLVVMDGDEVFVHYVIKDKDGKVLNDSRDDNEPLTFDVRESDQATWIKT